MSDRDRVIALLEDQNALLRAILLALSPDTSSARPASGAAAASDRDLDSQYGNPEVRGKDPRGWQGPTMRGRKYSECPAEYLDALAESLDWQAQQAAKKNELTSGGKPVAEYRQKDAARARGWAARIRAGKVQQAPAGPITGPAFEEPDGSGFTGSDFTPAHWR